MRILILCFIVSACSADGLGIDTCANLVEYDTCSGTQICVAGECQPKCKVDADCPEDCCVAIKDDSHDSACAPREYCQ